MPKPTLLNVSTPSPTAPVTLETISEKLDVLLERLESVEEKLETIDIHVGDIALDTQGGFEIDG